jgi:chromosome segregation ATPase
MDVQILDAINSLGDKVNTLSTDVHELNSYLSRLDERIIALDQKVDNRIQGIESQVKYLEQRMQLIVDKQQDFEVKFNRLHDKHENLQKDFDDNESKRNTWFNRFVIPLLLAGTIAVSSSLATISFSG